MPKFQSHVTPHKSPSIPASNCRIEHRSIDSGGLSAQDDKAHNKPGGAPKPASGPATIPAPVESPQVLDRSQHRRMAAWARGGRFTSNTILPGICRKLGERFNADEFGDRLLEAHVTGATVFAKDMYGYCYYPSSLGPMHPGLSFDILGAQVAALRKRKIQVLAYYMTTLNPQLAEQPSGMVECPPPPGQPGLQVREDLPHRPRI